MASLVWLSIDPRDGFELRRRQAAGAQDFEEQVRLAVDVAADVVGKLARQPFLERAVIARGVGMSAQVVSDREMIRERGAVERAQIEMMPGQSLRALERLAAADSQIALML